MRILYVILPVIYDASFEHFAPNRNASVLHHREDKHLKAGVSKEGNLNKEHPDDLCGESAGLPLGLAPFHREREAGPLVLQEPNRGQCEQAYNEYLGLHHPLCPNGDEHLRALLLLEGKDIQEGPD